MNHLSGTLSKFIFSKLLEVIIYSHTVVDFMYPGPPMLITCKTMVQYHKQDTVIDINQSYISPALLILTCDLGSKQFYHICKFVPLPPDKNAKQFHHKAILLPFL